MSRIGTLSILLLCFTFYGCDTSKKNDSTNSASETEIDRNQNATSLERIGLTIQLPEDWKSDKNENAYIFKKDCAQIFCTNLIVSTAINQNDLNLEQVVQSFVASLDQRFKEVKVLGITDDSVNGLIFKLVDYKMHEQDTHLGGTTAFTMKDGKIVSFNFMAENEPEGSYGDQRKVFAEILASIKP
jgi:hypothetical protein